MICVNAFFPNISLNVQRNATNGFLFDFTTYTLQNYSTLISPEALRYFMCKRYSSFSRFTVIGLVR
jgi:hypothetical protein